MKSVILAKIKENFYEIYESMMKLGLKRHKKHTVIISQSVIKFLDKMKKKRGSDSSSLKSSSEEAEELSRVSSGGSEYGEKNVECFQESEYNSDIKSFDNLNDSEVDKYFGRAKHHV
jgi:hypothetical protein